MHTEKNIFIAFILNLSFSVFEFFGGFFTGSVAILSDAVHDIGDAVSIGISCFMEKKSQQQPNETYTYGYGRYSVMGSFISTAILIVGSIAVIYNAVHRMRNPTEIHYHGMMVFAILGVCVNACAAFFTHGSHSLNQRAVNLHMLEDVLGWVVVLLGAIVIKFTGFVLIDPIMSIAVALFILAQALKTLKSAFEVFLDKTPSEINFHEVTSQIRKIEGITDVHHMHIWSIDGQNHCATMHVVTNRNPHQIKEQIRDTLTGLGICHATLELETAGERCGERECHLWEPAEKPHAHHHHHQHHHP